MSVAGTRNAKSAKAARRGKTPQMRASPARSSTARPAHIIAGTRPGGSAPLHHLVRGNRLVDNAKGIQNKHDRDQHSTQHQKINSESFHFVPQNL